MIQLDDRVRRVLLQEFVFLARIHSSKRCAEKWAALFREIRELPPAEESQSGVPTRSKGWKQRSDEQRATTEAVMACVVAGNSQRLPMNFNFVDLSSPQENPVLFYDETFESSALPGMYWEDVSTIHWKYQENDE